MSSNTENEKDMLTEYKQLIKLLENNYNYLFGAKANSNILGNYKNLLQHLKSRKEHDINLIIGGSKSSKLPKRKIELSDDQINNMSLEEIHKLLENKKTPRKVIEIIAVKRFGMSNSEVKSIGNKQKLIDQLFSIIENFKTHDSIKRIASKQ